MKNNDIHQKYESERINSRKIQTSINNNKKFLLDSINKNITQEKEVQSLSRQLELIGDFFIPSYTNADLLAIKYQKLYIFSSILIYFLAALATITVSIQSLFQNIPHNALLIEIISIMIIIIIIIYGNWIGWHRKWIDYRLLAERFRCAVFMALIGENISTQFSSHDLDHARDKDNWAFVLFRKVWHRWEQRSTTAILDHHSLELLKKYIHFAWLEDQKRFHQSKIKKHIYKHKRLSIIGLVLFVLTLVVALLHFFHIGGDIFRPYWSFLAISFPVIGLTFTALRAHFEHNKLARRSEQMVNHIEGIEERLEKVDNSEELLQVCRVTEVLMLNENAEWHVMIGFHKLEPPG